MIYQGDFKPPAMGANIPPIRVGGRGSLELGPDALTARGFLSAGSGLVALGLLVAILALAVVAALLAVDVSAPQRIVGSAVSGSISGLAVLAVSRRARVGKKPFEISIPYASIRTVAFEGTTGIRVECKAPPKKGSLHFHPDGGRDAALAALKSRVA